MSTRIRWDKIKQLIGQTEYEPDDLFLCVLPLSGRHILMAMMERLTWEATYRVDGYDYADWDALQAYVAATDYGLQRGVPMDALIAAIVAITDAIEALEPIINRSSNSLSCCPDPDLPTVSDTEVGEGDVPTPIVDLGYADWSDFADYLCVASHTLIDSVISIVEQYKELASAGLLTLGAIVALTGLFGPLGLAFGVTIGAAAALYGVLINLTDNTILDDLIAQLESDRNVISCLFQGSASADVAYAAWLEYVDGYGLAQKVILQNAVTQNTINAIFNGQHGDNTIRLGDYGPEDCDCTPDPEPSGTYFMDTILRLAETGASLQAQEINYYQLYRVWGDSAGAMSFTIRDNNVGGAALTPVKVEVRGFNGSSEASRPAMAVHDAFRVGTGTSLDNTPTVSQHNYADIVLDIPHTATWVRGRYYGTGNNTAFYIDLWFTPV